MRSGLLFWIAWLACETARAAAPSLTTDWPAYNRNLTAERFSPLSEISRENVRRLTPTCTFDTGSRTNFQTGLIVVEGLLIGTTYSDTFALDPQDCTQRWRVHEEYASNAPLKVNRGVAYLEGRVFRGTQDGRLIAYEAATGHKVWEVPIADPANGESVPAAPVAWNGLIFIGNAGGDNRGVRGRMLALDAASGKIKWLFHIVPENAADAKVRGWPNADHTEVTGGATWTTYTLDPQSALLYVPTGNAAPDFDRRLRPGENAYTGSVVVLDAASGELRRTFAVSPGDFHDYDVSTAPALITTREGRHVLAVAPKDGYLHAFDLGSGTLLYEVPITRIENRDAPLSDQPTHFCPGTQGGAEWNGPSFDPDTNLLYTGAVDWCATVTLAPSEETSAVAQGKPWTGHQARNASEAFGKLDAPANWAGWVYAINADSGKTHWRFRAPYPVMSGITSTAGSVVLAGDMGGTLYALDASTGALLWSRKLGGAIGGGVISYQAGGAQRIAVATGMTSPIWPTEKTNARITILSVPKDASGS